MQELLQLFGPAAWLTILAGGYLTQPLVNVWKMTGVKSNYVPLCALLTGIAVVGLLQVLQGLAFNPQGIAAVIVQGLVAGLGAIGLTEVHKKAEAQKQAGKVGTVQDIALPGNPYLPLGYGGPLDQIMREFMKGIDASLNEQTQTLINSLPGESPRPSGNATVEVNVDSSDSPDPADPLPPAPQEGGRA